MLCGQPGEAYNMGNDDAVCSVLELAQTVAGLFPEKNISVTQVKEKTEDGYLKSHVAKTVPDTSRLRALGWEPQVAIPEGFERTIRYYDV